VPVADVGHRPPPVPPRERGAAQPTPRARTAPPFPAEERGDHARTSPRIPLRHFAFSTFRSHCAGRARPGHGVPKGFGGFIGRFTVPACAVPQTAHRCGLTWTFVANAACFGTHPAWIAHRERSGSAAVSLPWNMPSRRDQARSYKMGRFRHPFSPKSPTAHRSNIVPADSARPGRDYLANQTHQAPHQQRHAGGRTSVRGCNALTSA
jgi:hypothetical protein